MTVQSILRFMWQIPFLGLLAAMLMPDWSWHSATFGAWPVWLLGMALAAFVRQTQLAKQTKLSKPIMKSAQVLVFQNKRVNPLIEKAGNREAA